MSSAHSRSIRLDGGIIPCLMVLYLAIGVALFLFGWLQLPIAIIAFASLCFASWRMLSDWRDETPSHVGTHSIVRDGASAPPGLQMRIPVFVATLVMLGAVAYLCGWGGLAPQSGDWFKHNAVLHDLIECPWPVVYANGDETSMLTYYIGQYLVAALAGKMTGSFEVAAVVLGLWSYLGLVIVYLGTVRVVGATTPGKQFTVLAVLMAFGALVVPGVMLVHLFYPNMPTGAGWHWFAFSTQFTLQYTPDLMQLRWVFNQTLPTWMVTLCFLEHRHDIRHYVVMALPLALYGMLPFLGVVVLMLAYAIVEMFRTRRPGSVLREAFSLENVLLALTLGTTLFLYFAGNAFSDKPYAMQLHVVSFVRYPLLYLVFVLFAFGFYALLVARENMHDPLFWISVCCLLVLPFFRMGIYNDLIMRVSIPYLLVLMFMVARRLVHDDASRIVKVLICVCLATSLLSPVYEIVTMERNDSISDLTQSADGFKSLGYSANRSREDKPVDLRYNYESYDLDDNVFMQYLARTFQPQLRED
jgi:hypothetical protein